MADSRRLVAQFHPQNVFLVSTAAVCKLLFANEDIRAGHDLCATALTISRHDTLSWTPELLIGLSSFEQSCQLASVAESFL